MAEPVIASLDLDVLPDLVVKYTPETQTLVFDTGIPWGDGEEIAKDLVVFYDHDNNVVGFTLECAELWLKPFVDAVLAKHKEA